MWSQLQITGLLRPRYPLVTMVMEEWCHQGISSGLTQSVYAHRASEMNWRTGARRSNSAIYPDGGVRRDAQICVKFGLARPATPSHPCAQAIHLLDFFDYILRACGLCGYIWPHKIIKINYLDGSASIVSSNPLFGSSVVMA
jgi:hypothetical protein